MKYLTHYVQDAQTKLFQECGAFFAFSQKQFDEKKRENTQYCDLGAGMVCEKTHVKKLINGLEEIAANGRKADLQENGAAAIIQREYFNYETQITMDTSDLMDALKPYQKQFPEIFTADLIKISIRKAFDKAVEEDLF